MTVSELIPNLSDLNRVDKLRVGQFLVTELAREEALLEPGVTYPVWSPYDAFDAAALLMEVLTRHKTELSICFE